MKIRLAAPLAAALVAASSLLTPAMAHAGAPAGDVPVGVPAASIANGALATVHEGATPGRTPKWRAKIAEHPNMKEMWAYSPAMGRNIPLVVITPADNSAPRPTLYLLNGGDGGEGGANWIMQTDVADFFADKNVNVVIPMSGMFSYYTDWVQPSQPQLGGKQMWETFLTKELPAPLEQALGASNERGIAGMSMSATSSLLLAEHNPGFYQAVGSFSGCAATNDPISDAYLRMTLDRGHTTPEAMWGPLGSETRHYNDALANSDKLRNHALYVSNASGVSGAEDMIENPRFKGNPLAVANVQIVGGAIEAGTNWCTQQLRAKLQQQNIPATFNVRNTGTHQWSYWQHDLRDSWPIFDGAWTTN